MTDYTNMVTPSKAARNDYSPTLAQTQQVLGLGGKMAKALKNGKYLNGASATTTKKPNFIEINKAK